MTGSFLHYLTTLYNGKHFRVTKFEKREANGMPCVVNPLGNNKKASVRILGF